MKRYDQWKKDYPESDALVKRTQTAIHSQAPDAEIILYGSRARGTAGVESDYDFLVLVDQPVDHRLTRKIRDKLYEVELACDVILSCIVRTKQEWNSSKYSILPFKATVEQEGVAL